MILLLEHRLILLSDITPLVPKRMSYLVIASKLRRFVFLFYQLSWKAEPGPLNLINLPNSQAKNHLNVQSDVVLDILVLKSVDI